MMMKKIVLMLALLVSMNAAAEPMCEVKVCNRIKRFSLDPFSHLKDHMGESCFYIQMPKSEAVVGKELSSESRWYQGSSINPTKRSVTTIKEIGQCTGS